MLKLHARARVSIYMQTCEHVHANMYIMKKDQGERKSRASYCVCLCVRACVRAPAAQSLVLQIQHVLNCHSPALIHN